MIYSRLKALHHFRECVSQVEIEPVTLTVLAHSSMLLTWAPGEDHGVVQSEVLRDFLTELCASQSGVQAGLNLTHLLYLVALSYTLSELREGRLAEQKGFFLLY